MIDIENQAMHRAYLETRLGCTLAPDAQFIAHIEPYGVVGFERWNGDDVELHYTGERGFLTRGFLRSLARYVFVQLGCERVTGRIPADRPLAAALGKRLGFTHEGTLRRGHNGNDIFIFGMLKEECRWL